VAALSLLGAYVALSFVMSPDGYLGSDTGAKVATLDAMVAGDTWQPDLGYWAEDLDPEGRLHPIFDAAPVDDGWVHVTTLPMLMAGRPLYDVGGYRLTLLLPMAGAIGAAFASRSLARRMAAGSRAEDAGWTAFWTVGLVSPIAIYALDFWEHAPGAACMVGAVAVLAGVVDGSSSPRWAVVAGALLGIAATMRTEALVYALVAVGLAGVIVLVRTRRLGASLVVGVGSVAGFAAPWILNRVVEQAVGGLDRGGRVSGATSAGVGELGRRVREAWTTLFAVRPADGAESIGLVLAALVAAAVIYQRRGDQRIVRAALVLAAALHVAVLIGGVDFVPGMLVAAPLAVVGLCSWGAVPGVAARYVYGIALLALPVVWAFQFLGGARPQWGGRYALTSCVLLVGLGAVHVVCSGDRVLRAGVLGLSALVTSSGVVWLHERSHAVDQYFAELVERPEDVVVVRNGFFVREGGAAYAERLWLTAVSDDDLDAAVLVVDASGFDSFAVLDQRSSAPSQLGEADLRATSRSTVAGTDFYLHSYVL